MTRLRPENDRVSQRPIFMVDYNNSTAPAVFVFSKRDSATDMTGNEHAIFDGFEVAVASDDGLDDGTMGYLVFNATLRSNDDSSTNSTWKWVCVIDRETDRFIPLRDASWGKLPQGAVW